MFSMPRPDEAVSSLEGSLPAPTTHTMPKGRAKITSPKTMQSNKACTAETPEQHEEQRRVNMAAHRQARTAETPAQREQRRHADTSAH